MQSQQQQQQIIHLSSEISRKKNSLQISTTSLDGNDHPVVLLRDPHKNALGIYQVTHPITSSEYEKKVFCWKNGKIVQVALNAQKWLLGIISMEENQQTFLYIYSITTPERTQWRNTFESPVVFIKWINDDIIGIVTKQFIYHLSSTDFSLQKIVKSVGETVEIVDYFVSPSLNSCSLLAYKFSSNQTRSSVLQTYLRPQKRIIKGENISCGCLSRQYVGCDLGETLCMITESRNPQLQFVKLEDATASTPSTLIERRSDSKHYFVHVSPINEYLLIGVAVTAPNNCTIFIFESYSGQTLWSRGIQGKAPFICSALRVANVNKSGLVITRSFDQDVRVIQLELLERNLIPSIQKRNMELATRLSCLLESRTPPVVSRSDLLGDEQDFKAVDEMISPEQPEYPVCDALKAEQNDSNLIQDSDALVTDPFTLTNIMASSDAVEETLALAEFCDSSITETRSLCDPVVTYTVGTFPVALTALPLNLSMYEGIYVGHYTDISETLIPVLIKTNNFMRDLIHEDKMLKYLAKQSFERHPSIKSIFLNITIHPHYLVLELFGEDLRNYMHPDNKSIRIILGRYILEAVALVHHAGIMHGDIKPSNILVEHRRGQYFIKLCDFDSSRFVVPPSKFPIVNNEIKYSAGWEAPEVHFGIPNELLASYEIDIFSAGMVILVLVQDDINGYTTGLPLSSNTHSPEEAVKMNSKRDAILANHENLTTYLAGFHLGPHFEVVSQMCSYDPVRRGKIAECLRKFVRDSSLTKTHEWNADLLKENSRLQGTLHKFQEVLKTLKSTPNLSQSDLDALMSSEDIEFLHANLAKVQDSSQTKVIAMIEKLYLEFVSLKSYVSDTLPQKISENVSAVVVRQNERVLVSLKDLSTHCASLSENWNHLTEQHLQEMKKYLESYREASIGSLENYSKNILVLFGEQHQTLHKQISSLQVSIGASSQENKVILDQLKHQIDDLRTTTQTILEKVTQIETAQHTINSTLESLRNSTVTAEKVLAEKVEIVLKERVDIFENSINNSISNFLENEILTDVIIKRIRESDQPPSNLLNSFQLQREYANTLVEEYHSNYNNSLTSNPFVTNLEIASSCSQSLSNSCDKVCSMMNDSKLSPSEFLDCMSKIFAHMTKNNKLSTHPPMESSNIPHEALAKVLEDHLQQHEKRVERQLQDMKSQIELNSASHFDELSANLLHEIHAISNFQQNASKDIVAGIQKELRTICREIVLENSLLGVTPLTQEQLTSQLKEVIGEFGRDMEMILDDKFNTLMDSVTHIDQTVQSVEMTQDAYIRGDFDHPQIYFLKTCEQPPARDPNKPWTSLKNFVTHQCFDRYELSFPCSFCGQPRKTYYVSLMKRTLARCLKYLTLFLQTLEFIGKIAQVPIPKLSMITEAVNHGVPKAVRKSLDDALKLTSDYLDFDDNGLFRALEDPESDASEYQEKIQKFSRQHRQFVKELLNEAGDPKAQETGLETMKYKGNVIWVCADPDDTCRAQRARLIGDDHEHHEGNSWVTALLN